MMTNKQRLSLIDWFKTQIDQKNLLLEEFKKNEQSILNYIQNIENGNVAIAAHKSFLDPQQNQIKDLKVVIDKMQQQLERVSNPEIETMSDEDALNFINS